MRPGACFASTCAGPGCTQALPSHLPAGTCQLSRHRRAPSPAVTGRPLSRLPALAQACPAGRYAEAAGARFCKECEAGSYASTPGSIACRPCHRGTASDVLGSSTPLLCKDCQPGYYQDEPGMSECKVGQLAMAIHTFTGPCWAGGRSSVVRSSCHLSWPCVQQLPDPTMTTEVMPFHAGLAALPKRQCGPGVWVHWAAGMQGEPVSSCLVFCLCGSGCLVSWCTCTVLVRAALSPQGEQQPFNYAAHPCP